MTDFVLWYILANISNRNKINLIKKYKTERNIHNIFCKNYNTIVKEEKAFVKHFKDVTKDIVNNFKKEISSKNIKYITINDDDYPEELKVIEEPPYVLFYKGNIDLLKSNRVSIVGARKCSNYGVEVCKMLVSEIVSLDFSTVSGLASGIDAVVHTETLNNLGKTIAVLGCGVDIVYPKSNSTLFKKVEEQGLILSEYLPNTEPFAFNFPRRNRIISALGSGLIVVEAARKSGTLITANCAADQGKNVMAIPGSIFNKNSIGCNELVRDGAEPFSRIEDLYDFLGITFKQKGYPKDSVKGKLLEILEKEPIHLDEILEKVDIDKQYVFKLLFEMQKLNEIICLPGNFYAKIC